MLKSYNTYDILIAPGAYHRTLLAQKSMARGDRFVLLTKEQVFERIYFKIHRDRALLYLFRKGMSLPKASALLDNLYFLKPVRDARLQTWITLREELIKEKAIVPNTIGSLFFKQKRVAIIGYPDDDIELMSALKPHVDLMDFDTFVTVQQPHVSLHVFLDTESEVRYGLNAMAHELNHGRSIDDIVIMRPSEEYLEPLKRLSAHYHLPIDFDERITFAQTAIGIQTLHAVERGESHEHILELLSHFPDIHRIPLLTIWNELNTLNLSHAQRVIWFAHQLRVQSIESPALTKAIRFKTSFVPTQQWVWVLGFNQSAWPVSQRDDDTVSDQLKTELGRLTSKQLNRFEHERSLHFLSRSPHCLVTYKRFHLGQAYEPSSLIHDCVIDNIVENPMFPVDYGRDQALITRERLMEKKTIYRMEDAYLSTYQHHVKDVVTPFDYQFKPWNASFQDVWNKLSYSKVSEYYKCRFRFYADKYLQLEPENDQFYAQLGSLMHNIFEKTQSSVDLFEDLFASQFTEFKTKHQWPLRKQLIVEGLKPDIKRVILFNLNHRSMMKLDTMVAEQEVKFNINPTMGFSGKMDKIVVTTDGQEKFVSLIDYKTGKESFVEDEIEIGWSLQLPVYAWLLSKHPTFKDYRLIGLYIQHILDDSLLNKDGMDDDEQHEKLLKLDGVSTEHMAALATFDPTYMDSEFIRSIKVKKDGTFGKKAKVRTKAQFESYVTIAEEKVLAATQRIQQGDFKINPIRFRKKHSCTHCPFQDVCFRKDSDVTYITLKKDQEDESTPNS